jgi:hypothetical protein
VSKPNPSIGTCPCPMRDCKRTAEVKKFQHKAVTDGRRRKAGKLYLDCPDHGRVGFDGREAMQEWILENAAIEGLERAPASSSTPASSSSTPSAPKPAPASTPPAKPLNGSSAPASTPDAPASTPRHNGFTLLG